jgi:Na+/proline symporter
LDIPYQYGIWFTAGLVILYIVFGGAHADMMGASTQGIIMTVVALLCLGIFVFTPGFEGGLAEVNEILAAKDPRLGVNSLVYTGDVLYGSVFTCALIFFAHVPYVFQPHFGVRFCALDKQRDFPKAIILASIIGTLFTVGAGLPGIFGRAVFDNLERADMVIPQLFSHFFPAPIAALVIIGILCACLSTVGGILLTFGQVFANDIYRRTLAPKMNHSEATIEQNVKIIARTCVALAAIAGTLIVIRPPQYLTIFIWIGVGGFMSAISGPLFLGAVWRGTTRAGATFGTVFSAVLYGYFLIIRGWSPMSTCGLMLFINIGVTYIVSCFTPKFSDEHLAKFGFPKKSRKLDEAKILSTDSAAN